MRKSLTLFTAAALCAFIAAASLAQQEGRSPRRSPTGGGQEAPGVVEIDREAAVGHALFMAIEGSDLWLSARQSERAITPRSEKSTRWREHFSRVCNALKSHARASFDASTRLFATIRASDDESASEGNRGDLRTQAREQFYRSARDYGQTLAKLCEQPGAKLSADESPGSGETVAAEHTGDRAGPPRMPRERGVDYARATLINHAVKEAVGAIAIRGMVRHHGDKSTPALALMKHADEMLASSEKAMASAEIGGIIDKTTSVLHRVLDFASNKGDDPAATPARGEIATPARAIVDELLRDGRDVVRAAEQLEQAMRD